MPLLCLYPSKMIGGGGGGGGPKNYKCRCVNFVGSLVHACVHYGTMHGVGQT